MPPCQSEKTSESCSPQSSQATTAKSACIQGNAKQADFNLGLLRHLDCAGAVEVVHLGVTCADAVSATSCRSLCRACCMLQQAACSHAHQGTIKHIPFNFGPSLLLQSMLQPAGWCHQCICVALLCTWKSCSDIPG